MSSTEPTPTALAALTDEDRALARVAAMEAAAVVSAIDPGLLDSFKEAFAASKAIRIAPEPVRALFVGMGMPSLPSGGLEALKAQTLDHLRQVAATLTAKAPELIADYRATVLASCRDVADAGHGTTHTETEVLAQIEDALKG